MVGAVGRPPRFPSVRPGAGTNAGTKTSEIADGLLLDVDDKGQVAGLDVDHTSEGDVGRA